MAKAPAKTTRSKSTKPASAKGSAKSSKETIAPAPWSEWLETGAKNVQLIYFCFLLLFVFGLPILFGLILAYLNRGGASGYLGSHYTYLIRSFWIGLLFMAISIASVFIVIGVVLIPVTIIWFSLRMIKGLKLVSAGKPVDKPGTWFF